jgi:tetratricopeptide (TPR) repeat protein
MTARIPRLLLAVLLVVAAAWPSPSLAQEKYKNYSDAFSQGNKLVREKQLAAAQEPLEAALKLATDDEQRLHAYELLVPVYRQLPAIDKMLEAQEFIIPHTERRSGRMNAARDLASFLHQRGKTDDAIVRYDARLQKDPKDVVALHVLTIIYTRIKRDEDLGLKYTQRLDEANRELASKLAERLEKDAAAAPHTAASTLKDAATAWLEAGDKPKALAAAKKSAASPPESRSDLLVYYWREGLGDVFLAAGEPKLAIPHFEAAIAVTPIAGHKQATEKKLAEAKAAAAKQ